MSSNHGWITAKTSESPRDPSQVSGLWTDTVWGQTRLSEHVRLSDGMRFVTLRNVDRSCTIVAATREGEIIGSVHGPTHPVTREKAVDLGWFY